MKKYAILIACLALPATAAIPLTNPGATFEQSGYPASKTIDQSLGRNNGWAVAPQTSSSHRIWWETNGISAGGDRVIDLDMSFRGTSTSTRYNIKRFEVAITRDATPSANSTWTTLDPITATRDGAPNSMTIDQNLKQISLVGNGTSSTNYQVSVLLPFGPAVTGISLRVIPVSGQVGTSNDGNFILTEIEASFPALTLTNAGATFAQSGYGPNETIDGIINPNNGWAVAPQTGSEQRIWWESTPLPANQPHIIDLEMNFRGATGSSGQAFNIRRFEISVTRDVMPSASSRWTPLDPVSASQDSNSMSIDKNTGLISLAGGGSISANYFVRVYLPAGKPITGISLRAIPVSGRLGTSSNGNFILTEFIAMAGPPAMVVPRNITLSEGSGPWDLKIQKSPILTGTTNLGGSWSGNATSGTDFNFTLPANFSLALTDANPQQVVTFTPLDDTANEAAESIEIQWDTDPSYALTNLTTTITIGDTDGSGFDDYVAGHGLVGNNALPDADLDGDGLTNIQAYAFRLNPAGPFPNSWRERLPRFARQSGGRTDFPALTWKLPQPYPEDVRFIVKEGPNLTSWTEIARRTGYNVGSLWTGSVTSAITDTGSPLRQVTVPATQNLAQRDRIFLQLTLEKTSSGNGSAAN